MVATRSRVALILLGRSPNLRPRVVLLVQRRGSPRSIPRSNKEHVRARRSRAIVRRTMLHSRGPYLPKEAFSKDDQPRLVSLMATRALLARVRWYRRLLR